MSLESTRSFTIHNLDFGFSSIIKRKTKLIQTICFVRHPPVVMSDSHTIKYAHLFFDDKHRSSITRVMNMDVSNYSLFVSHLMHE